MKSLCFRPLTAVAIIASAAFILAPSAQADNWGVHVSPGGWGVHYGSGHGGNHIDIDTGPGYYYQPAPVYRPVPIYPPAPVYQPAPIYRNGPYYPYYNPVVRRDQGGNVIYAPDGTVHSEGVTEDRHASYYSPGRNEAITAPVTTQNQGYDAYGNRYSQNRTSWIGADGRPHSTTVDTVTQTDIWGNTHSDSHVTLKSKTGGSAEGGQPTANEAPSSKPQNTGPTPKKQ